MSETVASSFRVPAFVLRRASRTASVVLLAIAALAVLGRESPTLNPFRTEPLQGACFLTMLFGLAIAWRHPLQGGVLTALATVALVALTHGTLALPALVFLVVAAMDVRCGWCEWREAHPR